MARADDVSMGAADQEAPGGPVLLEGELKRVRHSLSHLERSQRELQALIAAGDNDPEYRQAVPHRCAPNAQRWWLRRRPPPRARRAMAVVTLVRMPLRVRRQAINENIVTIAKHRARAEALEREIAQLMPAAADGASRHDRPDSAAAPGEGQVAVPVTEEDEQQQQEQGEAQAEAAMDVESAGAPGAPTGQLAGDPTQQGNAPGGGDGVWL